MCGGGNLVAECNINNFRYIQNSSLFICVCMNKEKGMKRSVLGRVHCQQQEGGRRGINGEIILALYSFVLLAPVLSGKISMHLLLQFEMYQEILYLRNRKYCEIEINNSSFLLVKKLNLKENKVFLR